MKLVIFKEGVKRGGTQNSSGVHPGIHLLAWVSARLGMVRPDARPRPGERFCREDAHAEQGTALIGCSSSRRLIWEARLAPRDCSYPWGVHRSRRGLWLQFAHGGCEGIRATSAGGLLIWLLWRGKKNINMKTTSRISGMFIGITILFIKYYKSIYSLSTQPWSFSQHWYNTHSFKHTKETIKFNQNMTHVNRVSINSK